jgi:hypothetical protein
MLRELTLLPFVDPNVASTLRLKPLRITGNHHQTDCLVFVQTQVR